MNIKEGLELLIKLAGESKTAYQYAAFVHAHHELKGLRMLNAAGALGKLDETSELPTTLEANVILFVPEGVVLKKIGLSKWQIKLADGNFFPDGGKELTVLLVENSFR